MNTIQFLGLLALHILCLFYLRLLWKEKDAALRRGSVFTKMGNVSKKASPRLFSFSIWIDFVVLLLLYAALIAYSIVLLMK